MSAYRGTTGTPMGFAWSCSHRWGPWEIGRNQRWRECTKYEQVNSDDLPVAEGNDLMHNFPDLSSRAHAGVLVVDDGAGPR